MIHGIHARTTSARCMTRAPPRAAASRLAGQQPHRRAASRLEEQHDRADRRSPTPPRPPATVRGSSRRGTAGSRTTTPATRIAGQTAHMPREPANAQTSQNGTITEKKGSWRPTIALRSCRSSSVTRLQRDDRRPERAERDRRGVGDERQSRGGERREAKADQNRAGDGDRRAETRCTLEERAEAERDEEQLQPPVRRHRGDAAAQDREQSAIVA